MRTTIDRLARLEFNRFHPFVAGPSPANNSPPRHETFCLILEKDPVAFYRRSVRFAFHRDLRIIDLESRGRVVQGNSSFVTYEYKERGANFSHFPAKFLPFSPANRKTVPTNFISLNDSTLRIKGNESSKRLCHFQFIFSFLLSLSPTLFYGTCVGILTSQAGSIIVATRPE